MPKLACATAINLIGLFNVVAPWAVGPAVWFPIHAEVSSFIAPEGVTVFNESPKVQRAFPFSQQGLCCSPKQFFIATQCFTEPGPDHGNAGLRLNIGSIWQELRQTSKASGAETSLQSIFLHESRRASGIFESYHRGRIGFQINGLDALNDDPRPTPGLNGGAGYVVGLLGQIALSHGLIGHKEDAEQAKYLYPEFNGVPSARRGLREQCSMPLPLRSRCAPAWWTAERAARGRRCASGTRRCA